MTIFIFSTKLTVIMTNIKKIQESVKIPSDLWKFSLNDKMDWTKIRSSRFVDWVSGLYWKS